MDRAVAVGSTEGSQPDSTAEGDPLAALPPGGAAPTSSVSFARDYDAVIHAQRPRVTPANTWQQSPERQPRRMQMLLQGGLPSRGGPDLQTCPPHAPAAFDPVAEFDPTAEFAPSFYPRPQAGVAVHGLHLFK